MVHLTSISGGSFPGATASSSIVQMEHPKMQQMAHIQLTIWCPIVKQEPVVSTIMSYQAWDCIPIGRQGDAAVDAGTCLSIWKRCGCHLCAHLCHRCCVVRAHLWRHSLCPHPLPSSASTGSL